MVCHVAQCALDEVLVTVNKEPHCANLASSQQYVERASGELEAPTPATEVPSREKRLSPRVIAQESPPPCALLTIAAREEVDEAHGPEVRM